MADPLPPSSRADGPPLKVVIGTCLSGFSGTLDQRLTLASRFFDEAAAQAQTNGRELDLMVLPETAVQSGRTGSTKERAVPLPGPVLETLGAKAREHKAYLLVPMFLAENDGSVSNAAVLLDREGREVGIYRKLHPVMSGDNILEGGVKPGATVPVFDCDFGKLGVQICWDMSYADGWDELARQGAEIVALPSASPQTLRPAAYALRGGYYVVNSTPRDNVTIFSPIGSVLAQRTAPGVLVHEIDLAYAIVHWAPNLDDGKLFTKTYGERAGFHYVSREDTGIFWSNDPSMPISAMLTELKLREMEHFIRRSREIRDDQLKSGPPR